ncbi:MAG: ZIP family metal transporter [Verrucomicrobia bacterium]|nr:ZIP family metal transporter [Verrucomicrobiota bacterium]MDA1086021.1 ZIP family metal transporter [Verrucomicrobiota bacterium]
MSSLSLILIYCLLIVLASMFGGWIPSRVRLTHLRMQIIMSLVAGLMLGVALLHLLPEAARRLPSHQSAAGWTLIGLLATFFLIRTFHFHVHGPAERADDTEHDHHHDDSHDHAHGHQLSWLGLAIGLSVHTLMDGVALGASVKAEPAAGTLTVSLAIFLAILLHKPLDALSITSLMAARGWPTGKQLMVNCGFAMMCPLGALLVWVGLGHFEAWQDYLLGGALAFSAGVFLCISLGDLLPEVHFHRHDRLVLSTALLAGVLIAVGLERLPGHSHGPRGAPLEHPHAQFH